MFSLITAIIAIVLVIAIAVATVYYGGSNFNNSQVNALAQTLVTQGNQIIGAAVIYQNEKGVDWPPSPQSLTPDFLQTMPVAPLGTYVKGLIPSPNDWQWLNGAHHLILPGINQTVCLALDKIYGLNAIPASINPDYVIQCYGTAEPYTFFYDPPASSYNDRNNLGGKTVPPNSSGSNNLNSDGSASSTPPGVPASGGNQTPILPAMPGFPAPKSPLPTIVLQAPFITPPNWTSNGNAPNEPTPPSSTPRVQNGWYGYVGYTGSQYMWGATPDALCQSAWSYYYNTPDAYYIKWASSTMFNCFRTADNYDYIMGTPQLDCPTGYTWNSYGGCLLNSNATVPLPADGRCEMTYSNGVLVPNSQDTDCQSVSTTQPGSAMTYGTAVWGNKTLLMNGNYGVGMAANPDGSVKVKQCTYSTSMGYTGCF